MQSAWYAWFVLIIGILLFLPLIGVTALGDLTTGVTYWAVPIIILLIGIIGLVKFYGKKK